MSYKLFKYYKDVETGRIVLAGRYEWKTRKLFANELTRILKDYPDKSWVRFENMNNYTRCFIGNRILVYGGDWLAFYGNHEMDAIPNMIFTGRYHYEPV